MKRKHINSHAKVVSIALPPALYEEAEAVAISQGFKSVGLYMRALLAEVMHNPPELTARLELMGRIHDAMTEHIYDLRMKNDHCVATVLEKALHGLKPNRGG